eukprot:CAMPEP_0172192642 /NCGR_PEP_ID=MMETSP1050-20130122/24452_1 /TAXON_ID=233186 /ORGANISM="Cryptomonas curvata, Strain CCAP979/52" /LENGTH=74 /DNA_ID=CAMNT_0012867989 /DNA_START=23 /DNA_END=243 /DNA_ORIENTATION=-
MIFPRRRYGAALILFAVAGSHSASTPAFSTIKTRIPDLAWESAPGKLGNNVEPPRPEWHEPQRNPNGLGLPLPR